MNHDSVTIIITVFFNSIIIITVIFIFIITREVPKVLWENYWTENMQVSLIAILTMIDEI